MEKKNKQIYNIIPVSAPRMTKADAWKKRACVLKYFAFRDEIKILKIKIPESGAHVTFVIPMPPSWSEKKKYIYNNQPHKNTPDTDNLLKALLDSIYKNDCHIWDIKITKLWGYHGKIIIE